MAPWSRRRTTSAFRSRRSRTPRRSRPARDAAGDRCLKLPVEVSAALAELVGLLRHPLREGLSLGDSLRRRVVAHVLRDLHRAEVRTAHRAEVRELRALGRQRLVVELAGGLRIEREVELVL